MKNYKITRECWNEKTYNGYTDNPYWLVTLEGNQLIALKDDGTWRSIKSYSSVELIEDYLEDIIAQCNLVMKLVHR